MPTLNRKSFAALICGTVLAFAGSARAQAMTITGTVLHKYLLTGSAVSVTATNAVLKISFETTTPGNNLALCAGSAADFSAGTCAMRLNDSGGPGFVFLTIVDAASLNGKHLFVIQEVGINPASFRFTLE